VKVSGSLEAFVTLDQTAGNLLCVITSDCFRNKLSVYLGQTSTKLVCPEMTSAESCN